MAKLPPVINLMGPTASGKTALAIALHQRLGGPVISVDSALIYRDMDIGTAKPTAEEQALAPHALIDICSPEEVYSAADFRADAIPLIDAAHAQGQVPILVGGTMLYFKSLVDGISQMPGADPQLREAICLEAEQQGWETLHQELSAVDPISATRINVNDHQRLIRAIEVYRISGKSLTDLNQVKPTPLPYDFKQFSIAPLERATLHQRIEQRFVQMLDLGFEQELRMLREKYNLSLELPSMRSVGYRQMWQYLDGEFSADELLFRGVAATRQLAKKQLTWLRTWDNLQNLDSDSTKNVEIVINSIT